MPTFPDDDERDYGLQKTVDSLLKEKGKSYQEQDEQDEGGEAEATTAGEKRADDLLEKYFSLNFEDLIAGEIPCRFKYRQVKPKTYGLDVDTILSLPDSELNRRVSLKKLAPYRHFNKNAKKRAARREKRKVSSLPCLLLACMAHDRLSLRSASGRTMTARATRSGKAKAPSVIGKPESAKKANK